MAAGDNLVDGLAGRILGIILILKADAGVLLERLDGFEHFGRALVAVGRVLLHRLLGDLAQAFRHVRRHLGQRLRLFGDLHDGDGHRAAAVKRQAAGQHFVQHDADRVDVGARVGAVALGLLGADIMHRADGLVADGLALRAGEAGDAEIHHLDGTVGLQHDVLRLDVAVDDPLGMGVVQRAEHLRGEMHDLFPGQRAAALLEVFFQRDAVDILHHDILQLVGDRNVVDLDDIGMVEDRDGLGFFLEHLDRNGVVGAHIAAFIHVGHAAHADQAFDQIAAVQLFANQVIHLRPPLFDRYFPRPTAAR